MEFTNDTVLPVEGIVSFDEQLILQTCNEIVCHLTHAGIKKTYGDYIIEGCRSDGIGMELKKIMVDMVESALKSYYESAWGWSRDDKMKELFTRDAHFIIIRNNTNDNNIVGFAMYRFLWDDDEEPEFPCLYLMELNILSECRGHGIGKYIIDLLFKIQNRWNLWKVMLTCFIENEPAMKFYMKLGFGIDVYSPSRCEGWEPEKYEILSNRPNVTS